MGSDPDDTLRSDFFKRKCLVIVKEVALGGGRMGIDLLAVKMPNIRYAVVLVLLDETDP